MTKDKELENNVFAFNPIYLKALLKINGKEKTSTEDITAKIKEKSQKAISGHKLLENFKKINIWTGITARNKIAKESLGKEPIDSCSFIDINIPQIRVMTNKDNLYALVSELVQLEEYLELNKVEKNTLNLYHMGFGVALEEILKFINADSINFIIQNPLGQANDFQKRLQYEHHLGLGTPEIWRDICGFNTDKVKSREWASISNLEKFMLMWISYNKKTAQAIDAIKEYSNCNIEIIEIESSDKSIPNGFSSSYFNHAVKELQQCTSDLLLKSKLENYLIR